MTAKAELAGRRVGRLVVLDEAPRPVGASSCSRWNVRCDCGTVKQVIGKSLLQGLTLSCGCLGRDIRRARNFRHGHTGHPLFMTWKAMWRRCTVTTSDSYPRYGGRGIRVCKRWRSFVRFLADMGPKPEGTSMDRIDNDGDYKPSNCRWATPLEQSMNKRNNVFASLNGERLLLAEWGRRLGIPYDPVKRLRRLGAVIESGSRRT